MLNVFLKLLPFFLISLMVEANIREPHIGGICHVEAEYFYPGVWEKYGENSCQHDYDKNAEHSVLL